jgi:fatty-acyl-CoA synthase
VGLIERLRGDVITLKGALRTLKATTPIAKNPNRVFPDVIDDLAEKFGDAPALLSDRERLSYRALAERANRYARFALAQGLAKGDAICLMMPNRPEFMAIWLGFTRAGGVVALVNTNLAGAALAHCINVVAPKHVVVAAELAGAFASARPHLAVNAKVWLHGADGADLPRIDQEIDGLPGAPLEAGERRALTTEDRALYIYTSGTTGMPKAANINHYRLMLASHGFAGIMDTKPSDRLYDCLPMYHTVGGSTGAPR